MFLKPHTATKKRMKKGINMQINQSVDLRGRKKEQLTSIAMSLKPHTATKKRMKKGINMQINQSVDLRGRKKEQLTSIAMSLKPHTTAPPKKRTRKNIRGKITEWILKKASNLHCS